MSPPCWSRRCCCSSCPPLDRPDLRIRSGDGNRRRVLPRRYDPRRLAVEGRKRRRKRDRGKAGAGKSTLNRLELTPPEADEKSRYKKIVLDTAAVDDTLVNLYIQRQRRQPRQIVLDLDATDDRLHGHQQGRFFHGYYGHYCYLPLYIFIGEHLLCARLRDPKLADCQTWPEVEIIVRGDAGFCRQELMSWCEKQQVDYVFGLAPQLHRYLRLRRLQDARQRKARSLYEDLYCARGEMENRIKEQQLDLFADRTSTALMRSNQIRLYFSSIAYCLLQALRELGLQGTKMARAQCSTIRVRLLKMGARVRVTARKVWISMATGHPAQALFAAVYGNLERGEPLRC